MQPCPQPIMKMATVTTINNKYKYKTIATTKSKFAHPKKSYSKQNDFNKSNLKLPPYTPFSHRYASKMNFHHWDATHRSATSTVL